jgi:hypothetical protein
MLVIIGIPSVFYCPNERRTSGGPNDWVRRYHVEVGLNKYVPFSLDRSLVPLVIMVVAVTLCPTA